jgi:hypothetical protein
MRTYLKPAIPILAATAIFSSTASADAFLALDPRSMSLGGAGVASTRPYNAAFFNPARLAGNPPLERQVPSMGCNIKWIEGAEPEYFTGVRAG